MSLTKEQCERALSDLKMANEYPVRKYNDSRLIDHHLITFKQLIYEHFEITKEKECLEKALDKACEELENLSYVKGLGQVGKNFKEWKAWCLKNVD